MNGTGQVKFQHTCLGCKKYLQLYLDLNLVEIQKRPCPYCGHIHAYDNRDGKLASIYREKLRALSTPGTLQESRPAEKTTLTASRPLSETWASPPAEIIQHAPVTKSVPRTSLPGSGKPEKKTGKKFTTLLSAGLHRPKMIAVMSTGIVLLSVLVMVVLFQFSGFFISEKNIQALISGMKNNTPNVIYDRNGLKISELARNRTGNLRFEEIPGHFKDLLLSAEDKNFYHHNGTDFPAFARAFLINLISMRYSQGASTITQQLVRSATGERNKSIFRKFREISTALALERELDKDTILTLYINRIYLGHGAYGFDSASRFYFGKALKQLNSAEMLALVSLPPAPEKFSPLRNPALLEKKMDYLFSRFYPEQKLSSYSAEKKKFLYDTSRSATESVFGTRNDASPFTTEYVRRKLQELLGEQFAYDSGLKIETTIDYHLQKRAEGKTALYIRQLRSAYKPQLMKEGHVLREDKHKRAIQSAYENSSILLEAFGFRAVPFEKDILQAASVGIQPSTGEILFMIGGAEFSAVNQLHRAYQTKRQTGSAIKPIIYSAAIESGIYHAMSEVEDSPILRSGNTGNKKYWLPENITGVYEGKISLRRALAHSKNVPAIRTASHVGLERIAEQFKKFFFHTSAMFKSRFRHDETVAIGSLEMSPLEMSSAFAAFANNGIMVRPSLIKRITDTSGTVLYESARQDEFSTGMTAQKKVLDSKTNQIMVSLMGDSAKRGGTGMKTIFGKTGTSNDYKDAWFVGGSRNLVAAVWVGFDNGEHSMGSATGAGVSGPLFSLITSGYHGGKMVFSPPAEHIKVCALTGKLPSASCSETRIELFNSKLQPTEPCPHNQKIASGNESKSITEMLQKDFD